MIFKEKHEFLAMLNPMVIFSLPKNVKVTLILKCQGHNNFSKLKVGGHFEY